MRSKYRTRIKNLLETIQQLKEKVEIEKEMMEILLHSSSNSLNSIRIKHDLTNKNEKNM